MFDREAANKFKDATSDLAYWRARVGSCKGLTLRSLILLSIQVRSTDFSGTVPKVG